MPRMTVTIAPPERLHYTGNDEADRLNATNPLADRKSTRLNSSHQR